MPAARSVSLALLKWISKDTAQGHRLRKALGSVSLQDGYQILRTLGLARDSLEEVTVYCEICYN